MFLIPAMLAWSNGSLGCQGAAAGGFLCEEPAEDVFKGLQGDTLIPPRGYTEGVDECEEVARPAGRIVLPAERRDS